MTVDNNNENQKPPSGEDEKKRTEEHPIETLVYSDNPQEILYHLSNEYPDIFMAGVNAFQKQMKRTSSYTAAGISRMKLCDDQKEALGTNEGLISALSYLNMPELMLAVGVWNTHDFKLYSYFKQKLANMMFSGVNKQFQQRNINVRIFPADVEIPFERVIECAEAEGHIFSHNKEMVQSITALREDLSLFASGYMNLRCVGFKFDDGTPPVQDWSRNKTLQEMEEIILYNSFMLGHHLSRKLSEERENNEAEITNTDGLKMEHMWALGNRLTANRLAETSVIVGLSARACLLDDPVQFVQIAMMTQYILKHMPIPKLMSDFEREVTLYHFTQKTREAVQEVYQNDSDSARMILSWYDYGCSTVIEKLSPEVRQVEIVIQRKRDAGDNNSHSGKTREQ